MTLEGHQGPVYTVQKLNKDTIISGSDDHTIKVLDYLGLKMKI